MKDIFCKYLNNQCSPQEVKELLAWFSADDESVLRALITASLEEMDVEDKDEDNKWSPVTDKLFANIKAQIKSEKGKVVPVLKRPWVQIAAAVLLVVGGFAVFNLIKKTNPNQNVVNIDTPKQDADSGSNKAILTLADGSSIVLETAANGTVTQQGNSKIVKPANGQLAYNLLNEKTTEVLFNSIATPRGGQYQLIFSDGSKAWLNAASSLRFPVAFIGNERKVELTGEAYFEVAKNASMPFKVEIAGKGEVEVLGTHFNVSAYREEATANTTLLEGSVRVIGLATGDSHIINPGEQAQVDSKGQISVNKNADTKQAIAWKNGTFNFSNVDLAVALRQLSRWYDVDIKFEGSVPQRHFTGEIHRDLKLQQVLKLLEENNVFCKLEGKMLIVKQ